VLLVSAISVCFDFDMSAKLVEASAKLKDDTQRNVLLRGVVVVAQKGLGVAPDGVTECEPNVLTFPER